MRLDRIFDASLSSLTFGAVGTSKKEDMIRGGERERLRRASMPAPFVAVFYCLFEGFLARTRVF
jgi:hypothetical protein